jgi:hypothetical protein
MKVNREKDLTAAISHGLILTDSPPTNVNYTLVKLQNNMYLILSHFIL